MRHKRAGPVARVVVRVCRIGGHGRRQDRDADEFGVGGISHRDREGVTNHEVGCTVRQGESQPASRESRSHVTIINEHTIRVRQAERPGIGGRPGDFQSVNPGFCPGGYGDGAHGAVAGIAGPGDSGGGRSESRTDDHAMIAGAAKRRLPEGNAGRSGFNLAADLVAGFLVRNLAGKADCRGGPVGRLCSSHDGSPSGVYAATGL